MHCGPLGLPDVGIVAGGIVMHHTASQRGIDKGAELVNGLREYRGDFVTTVLKPQYPVAITLFGKGPGNLVGPV